MTFISSESNQTVAGEQDERVYFLGRSIQSKSTSEEEDDDREEERSDGE